MEAFSKWLTGLSYWWIILVYAVIMVGLAFIFSKNERTKPVRCQLLVLCGIDLIALLFFLLTFSLRVSKLAAEAGATPRTMPRVWAALLVPVSVGCFVAILKEGAKPDPKFKRWVFALLVGVGSIVSVMLFSYIGYYLSTALFIFVLMIAMGERNKLQLILVPVIWCIFVYFVFYKFLYIKLPFGSLFSWLVK